MCIALRARERAVERLQPPTSRASASGLWNIPSGHTEKIARTKVNALAAEIMERHTESFLKTQGSDTLKKVS